MSIANELEIDRLDLRLKHFPAPTEFPFAHGVRPHLRQRQLSGGAVQGEGARRLGSADERSRGGARRRAVCSASACRPTSRSARWGRRRRCQRAAGSGAACEWRSPAKVTVITGVSPHGQGQETSFAQIAADRLGVPIEDVVVLHGDTNVAHYGRDTYGSRGMAVGGSAIVMCIDKILAKAKTLAAHIARDDRRSRGVRRRRVQLAGGDEPRDPVGRARRRRVHREEPAAGLEPGLEASSFFEPSNFTFPFGTHIGAVDVDRDTGQRQDHQVRRGRRLRPADQPAARRRPGAGRHRAFDRPGAVRADDLRRERSAAHRRVHGLCDAARDRHPRLHPRPHRDAVAGQSAGRQGRRRSRHDWRDAGDRQRGARRAGAARHHAPGSADDAGARLAGDQVSHRGSRRRR